MKGATTSMMDWMDRGGGQRRVREYQHLVGDVHKKTTDAGSHHAEAVGGRSRLLGLCCCRRVRARNRKKVT